MNPLAVPSRGVSFWLRRAERGGRFYVGPASNSK